MAWSNGYNYRRTITVDHSKCGSADSSSFPLLFAGTHSYLAVTGSGGAVTSSSGYDIIFTSDAAGSNKLDHEIEKYVSTTGEVVMWVRLPTLAYASDTVIYLFYGNSSISTSQQNKTGVWDSNFVGVYHLPDGSTLTANDSTSYGNNSSAISAPAATTGKIDGGADFDGTDDYIHIPDSTSLRLTSTLTLSAWVYADSLSGSRHVLSKNSNGSANCGYYLRTSGTQIITGTISGWSWDQVIWNAGANWPTGTWAFIQGVRDGTNWKIYFNGVEKASEAHAAATGEAALLHIGTNAQDHAELWDGKIDEVHLSNVARSASWILAEYNNQNSPSTFYTVGAADSGLTVPVLAYHYNRRRFQ